MMVDWIPIVLGCGIIASALYGFFAQRARWSLNALALGVLTGALAIYAGVAFSLSALVNAGVLFGVLMILRAREVTAR